MLGALRNSRQINPEDVLDAPMLDSIEVKPAGGAQSSSAIVRNLSWLWSSLAPPRLSDIDTIPLAAALDVDGRSRSPQRFSFGKRTSSRAAENDAAVDENSPQRYSLTKHGKHSSRRAISYDPADDNTFPILGVRLTVFDTFIEQCGGADALRGITTGECCAKYLLSLTAKDANSYCQMLQEQGDERIQRATVFVSHAWSYPFLDVVEALRYRFASSEEDIVIWFDFFSNNQHEIASKDIFWITTVFSTSIEKIGRVFLVLHPWEDPIALKRAWCLYEIYCTILSKARFEVIMAQHQQEALARELASDSSAFDNMLATIDVQKSSATKIEERAIIMRQIEHTLGWSQLNQELFKKLREGVYYAVQNEIVRCNKAKDLKQSFYNKIALAELYRSQGLYDNAMEMLEALLVDMEQTLGAKNDLILTAENNLAEIYRTKGYLDKAYELHGAVLHKRTLMYGEANEDSLISLCNLGHVERNQGHYDLAEKSYLQCLEASKGFLQTRPYVLIATKALAELYRNMGQFDKSEKLFRELLQKKKAILAAAHPEIIISMHDLANVLRNRGNFIEAKSLLDTCLSLSNAKLGDTHPVTLECMMSYGNWCFNQSLFTEAEKYYKGCYESFKNDKNRGESHVDTLNAANHLAHVYSNVGRFNEAEVLLTFVWETRKRELTEEHPDTLKSMHNYAELLRTRGNYAHAREMHDLCLALRVKKLGATHPHVLVSMHTVAELFRDEGDFQRALEVQTECLRLRRDKLGSEHPYTLMSMNSLVEVHINRSEYSEANALCEECLVICKQQLSNDHIISISTISNMGHIHYCRGEFDVAKSHYKRALTLITTKYGEDHPQALVAKNALANALTQLKAFDEAEAIYLQCLKTRNRTLPKDHLDTLKSMSNLAELYRIMRVFEKAESIQQYCFETLKSNLGEHHPHTIQVLSSLAEIYRTEGNYDKAAELHTQCLQLRCELLREDNRLTMLSMYLLAETLRQLDRTLESMDMHEKCCDLRREKLGPFHIETLTSLRTLADLYVANNCYHETDRKQAEVKKDLTNAAMALDVQELRTRAESFQLLSSSGSFDLRRSDTGYRTKSIYMVSAVTRRGTLKRTSSFTDLQWGENNTFH